MVEEFSHAADIAERRASHRLGAEASALRAIARVYRLRATDARQGIAEPELKNCQDLPFVRAARLAEQWAIFSDSHAVRITHKDGDSDAADYLRRGGRELRKLSAEMYDLAARFGGRSSVETPRFHDISEDKTGRFQLTDPQTGRWVRRRFLLLVPDWLFRLFQILSALGSKVIKNLTKLFPGG